MIASPRRALWLWGPPVIWMALIFILSSYSDLPAPPDQVSDKDLHGLTFAVLAALLVRALASARWSGVTLGRVALAVLVAVAYGAFDELHQRFVPGREASLLDLGADAAGACAAAGLVLAWGIIRATFARRAPHTS